MSIHKTAVVHKGAVLGEGVDIGPYTVIEDAVKIGPRVKIWAHAYIASGTEIAEDCEVHMGAVLGHLPQDTHFKGGKSYLRIGKKTVMREYVTIHRGTEEGSVTVIGENNFLMGFVHIGHNVKLGNDITIVNMTALSGHVEVEDGAFISGYNAVHQFVRIGRLAMIGGFGRVGMDVPPYMLHEGDTKIRHMNIVGMKRAGLSQETRNKIKQAYKILYHSGLNVSNAVKELEKAGLGPEVEHIIEFIKRSKRGICPHY